MTIQDIRCCMHKFEEALYPGMELEISGESALLAVIFREENRLTLCLFAEDEDVTELQEERVKMESLWQSERPHSAAVQSAATPHPLYQTDQRRQGTLTLWEEKMMELNEGERNLLEVIRGIRINGKEYGFRSGSGGRMEEYNLEGRGLVYQLMFHGVSFGFPAAAFWYKIPERLPRTHIQSADSAFPADRFPVYNPSAVYNPPGKIPPPKPSEAELELLCAFVQE